MTNVLTSNFKSLTVTAIARELDLPFPLFTVGVGTRLRLRLRLFPGEIYEGGSIKTRLEIPRQ